MSTFFSYIIVVILGGGVGLAELVSRYRDAPLKAVSTLPALLYVGINAAAALLALFLIQTFGWTFGIEEASEIQALAMQVLVAGTGAMILFRSSLFTVNIGEQAVGIGPSSFLQILLTATDRGVDRLRAESRAFDVVKIMNDVSYERAEVALPIFSLELMQNLSVEEQQALGEELKALKEAPVDGTIKSLILGLKMVNVVGIDVLEAAIDALGIKKEEAEAAGTASS